jgi:hypothetical protein
MYATPQPINHKQMHESLNYKNFQKKTCCGLGDSRITSPEQKDGGKILQSQESLKLMQISSPENHEKQSKRRGSQITSFGKRYTTNCVLCCNSLHPIFE